jgi:hypothetical protein
VLYDPHATANIQQRLPGNPLALNRLDQRSGGITRAALAIFLELAPCFTLAEKLFDAPALVSKHSEKTAYKG